jgi:hypothetical protein
MRMQDWALTIVLSLLIATMQGQTKSAVNVATRSGETITIHPSGATFTIPAEWTQWYDRFHNNLHLTGEQLASVRYAVGEWDTEYATVTNSVMPFEDCVAHLGGEGWGKEGVSFADVQLRVYVTPLSEERVQQHVSVQGLAAAKRISSMASATLIPTAKMELWDRTSLKYELFYGDYGGIARIDFFTTTQAGQTIVLVFMYCDPNNFNAAGQVEAILHSFRVPEKETDRIQTN